MRSGFELTTPGSVILVIVFVAQALKEMGIPSFGLTHTILLFAGYQLVSGSILLGVAVILSICLGSLCGAGLVFNLARWKGDRLLAGLVGQGLVKPEAMPRLQRILKGPSAITVATGRSIPGLMLPTSLLAGMLDIPASGFFTGVLIPLALWVSAIVVTGGTLKLVLPHIAISPEKLLALLWPLIGLVGVGTFLHLRKRTPGAKNGKLGNAED